MENLPNEILYEILSYLSYEERYKKRIVCRLWDKIIPILPLRTDEKSTYRNILTNMGTMIHFSRFLIENYYNESSEIFFLIELYDSKDNKICETYLDENNDYQVIIEYNNLPPNLCLMFHYFIKKVNQEDKILKMMAMILSHFITQEGYSSYLIKVGDEKINIGKLVNIVRENINHFFEDEKSLWEIYTEMKNVENDPIFKNFYHLLYEFKTIIPPFIWNDKKLIKQFVNIVFE